MGTALLCGAAPAGAHAYLDHSNPADGATVARAPDTLRLFFSEHVVLSATTLQLFDAQERRVPLARLRLDSANLDDTEAPAQIVADLPDLPTGTYRLTWSTLSSDDLHRTSGVLAFGVRAAVAGGGVDEADPDPLEAVAGAVLLGGMALLLGAPLALRTLRPASPPVRRRIRRAAVLGGLLAIGAALLGPVREALAGDAAVLLAGGYAGRWVVRTAGIALLVHGIRAPGRHASLVVGAALAAAGQTLLGHAVAQSAGDPLRVPVTTVHLLAALGWTGAVAGIAIGLAGRPRQSLPAAELGAALRGFAVPAAVGLAIAVVTGVWLASDVVVSADAAVLTSYGRTLLVKLAVVAAVCGLALVNHRGLRRRGDVPRRTITAEAVAVGGVIALTALLLAGQPATEPQLADAGTPPNRGPIARQVGDLEEALSLRPNRAGPSVVLVDLFDRRRPAPGPVSGVTIQVGGTDLGGARPLGDGHWSAPAPDLPSGPTAITVTVTRPGIDPVTATYPWVVGPATPPPSAVVSRTPLTPAVRLLAATLAGVAAGFGLVALRRRARRAPAPDGSTSARDEEPALP
ncbi:copper resistance protein CopC [Nocardioides panacihumi]|uniref:copper resistance CopC/CopD family protein n=1 Tax=Nocardioides panacihumi TaxID=400774 RepID=UPI0031DACDA0